MFHVFQYGTSNCALPFDYDNNYVSSQTDASVYAKNATCGIGGPYGSYNNEARVYWPGSDVNGGQYYYGGVEFRLNNGDLYTPATGKVANDLYFYGLVGSQKDNVSNGTWCFDGTNGHVWGC